VSYTEEFATVELLLNSKHETLGVDAFALSLIKAERQMRRLVTYLVYQSPCFGKGHAKQLRDILQQSRYIYFDGLERGFDALYPKSISHLVGADYDALRGKLRDARRHRNKIFHGLLTAEYLSRDQLLGYVVGIRRWCEILANAASTEIGYDGFGRNSFRKCARQDFHNRLKVQFSSADDYATFIRENMERRGPRGAEGRDTGCGETLVKAEKIIARYPQTLSKLGNE
jgi:hypothetical protein